MIDYAYDSLSRQTSETWYDDLADADAQQNAEKTYSTTYDDAGRVASVGDGDYDFEYTYSILGNLTSTTQDLTGLTDDVEFTYRYDVLGRKTSVAAKVGSTDDYVNTYSYDNLGRITQITQEGVSGGNAVAEKRVDFAYNGRWYACNHLALCGSGRYEGRCRNREVVRRVGTGDGYCS